MQAISRAFRLGIGSLISLTLVAGISSSAAAQDVNFKGKTITVLVGSTPGGSTDLSARLIAPFIAKYLPGHPNSVVQNMPGAHGMTANNYFAQVIKPDGLTTIWASNQQIDPNTYRVPQSHYDPTKYAMIGGLDVGGTFLIIRNEALANLKDKSAPPVTMGSVSGFPRSGMLMADWGAKFLGWNIKWVPGYRGSSSLVLALRRGEFDMTSFSLSTAGLRRIMTNKKKYTILYQTGSHAGTTPTNLPSLTGVPMFSSAMKGRISDPVAKDAFNYWRHISSVIKWIALPPKTPKTIIAAYRASFKKTIASPTFLKKGKNLSADFSLLSARYLNSTAEALAKTSSMALNYMPQLLHEEGFKVTRIKRKKKKK